MLQNFFKNKEPSETRNFLNLLNVHCMTGYILEEWGITTGIPIFKQREKKALQYLYRNVTLCVYNIY
jgi:hypothetical protein